VSKRLVSDVRGEVGRFCRPIGKGGTDAMHSRGLDPIMPTRAAVEERIPPGGGVSLLRASRRSVGVRQ
jgi:hypothetical protein